MAGKSTDTSSLRSRGRIQPGPWRHDHSAKRTDGYYNITHWAFVTDTRQERPSTRGRIPPADERFRRTDAVSGYSRPWRNADELWVEHVPCKPTLLAERPYRRTSPSTTLSYQYLLARGASCAKSCSWIFGAGVPRTAAKKTKTRVSLSPIN